MIVIQQQRLVRIPGSNFRWPRSRSCDQLDLAPGNDFFCDLFLKLPHPMCPCPTWWLCEPLEAVGLAQHAHVGLVAEALSFVSLHATSKPGITCCDQLTAVIKERCTRAGIDRVVLVLHLSGRQTRPCTEQGDIESQLSQPFGAEEASEATAHHGYACTFCAQTGPQGGCLHLFFFASCLGILCSPLQ